ncbi:MAG: hypothetical protein U1E56_02860 [Bauldia sp.]
MVESRIDPLSLVIITVLALGFGAGLEMLVDASTPADTLAGLGHFLSGFCGQTCGYSG